MFIQDLRYAFRSFIKRPGFTAIAVITLSLGIGATTAIFSVVQAVLLRPLEFPNADRLVKVAGFDRADNVPENLSPADFFDYQRDATSFARMGANGYLGLETISGGHGEAERVGSVRVTGGYFATLQVRAALGRVLTAEDDRPGAPLAILISDGFWRRRFGADPSIVGRTVTLNATPAIVVGVLPSSYRHIEISPERTAEMFTAFRWDAEDQANRGGHFIRAVARLKDGATVEQARAELIAMAARLEQEHPKENTNNSVTVTPLLEAMVGESRPLMLLLSAAVIVVLLVACANVANLLLARGTSRLRELALRAAIGADRRRLIRQMLTESAALSMLGAAGGLLIAWPATRGLTILAAAGIARADQIHVDPAVLLFALAASLATGLLFGMVPALYLSRQDLHDALKEGGRQNTAAVGRGSRELLIVAEVALSIMLLVGAGLLIRSLWQLQQVNPGFTAEHVLTMEVSLPIARYPEGDQMPFYQQLEDRVRALPGVSAVGAINMLPLSNNYNSEGVQIEEHPMPEGQGPAPQVRSVTPGYFRAMGIPLLRGRLFDTRDIESAPHVVIISESMAKKYWPTSAEATVGKPDPGDVIGKRVIHRKEPRTVIGIVGDVKHLALNEDEVPMMYQPHTQQVSYHTMRLVIRATGDAASLTGEVRDELNRMDREVPLSQVATLSSSLDRNVAQPRMRATLLGFFAGLAMVLAAIGVYGVVAYLVGQRTQEIGVRRALGANAAAVIAMLMREAMRPVIIGMVIGIGGAMAMTRLLAAMLFEISATDVATYVVACGVLALSALIASIVPARKALSVDPINAVRGQS